MNNRASPDLQALFLVNNFAFFNAHNHVVLLAQITSLLNHLQPLLCYVMLCYALVNPMCTPLWDRCNHVGSIYCLWACRL